MLEHGIELASQRRSTWAGRPREARRRRPGSQSRRSTWALEFPSLVECARGPVEVTAAAEVEVEIDAAAVPGDEAVVGNNSALPAGAETAAALGVEVADSTAAAAAAPGADAEIAVAPGDEAVVGSTALPAAGTAGVAGKQPARPASCSSLHCSQPELASG